MRARILGFSAILSGAAWWFFQGLIEHYLFDRILHLLAPYLDAITIDLALRYGPPIVLIAIGLVLLLRKSGKLKPIFNRHFKNERVRVDGNDFHNCTFENVTFEFRGGAFSFTNVKVIGHRRFETPRPEIAGAVTLLKLVGLLGDADFAKDWQYLPPEHFKKS